MMGFKAYVCDRCGERGKFQRTVYGRASFYETEILDSQGEVVDYSDREYDNDQVDDRDPVECSECGREGVEEFDDEKEMILFLAHHTMKDGSWSKDELPEPNEDVLKREIAMKL